MKFPTDQREKRNEDPSGQLAYQVKIEDGRKKKKALDKSRKGSID